MSNSFSVNSETSKLFFLATYSASNGVNSACLFSISLSAEFSFLFAADIALRSSLALASFNSFSASCLFCNAAKIANIFLFGKDEIAEDYGDTIKGFAQNLRGGSLGKLGKLDEGGLVQTSGVAEVHSGETYLGANSLQLIKMTAENSRKTVELLAKLANQKSDVSNAQIKFVTGNVVLDGVPTGKLMLNSFENNSYTKFDTTRYTS